MVLNYINTCFEFKILYIIQIKTLVERIEKRDLYHLSAKVRISKPNKDAPREDQTRWEKVETTMKENQLKMLRQTVHSKLSTTHCQIKIEEIWAQVESYSTLIN